MLLELCVIGAAILGGLGGAAAMTTKKGKEMDNHLKKSWDNYKKQKNNLLPKK